MTQQTAKTGAGSVGYTPNSRPPDPPPLSVTPLILALRAPIRHIFEEIPPRENGDIWVPGCLYARNDKGGGQDVWEGGGRRRSGRQRNKNDQPRCWRKKQTDKKACREPYTKN